MRLAKEIAALGLMASVAGVSPLAGQQPLPGEEGSSNIELVSHIPLGAALTVSDVEIEQEMSRPYAYVGRMGPEYGFDIIDLSDPSSAKLLHSWRIENAALHVGTGMMDGKTFKDDGRYYYVQSTQFGQGGADADVGAIIFDVTGLPDTRQVREVARISEPDHPGGFHNFFIYKHSDGRPLLITTVSGPYAHVYDLSEVVAGRPGLAGLVPIPDGIEGSRGYHDMYAAFDPATGTDKFYGGGTGGYHIYDITDVSGPEHLFSLVGISGVTRGHTFTPTPDGKYAIGETEYQYAPLRIYDLQPGQNGETRTISRPIGAWTANWKNLVHNHEVRWPYVFVSGYEDGLQVFNMLDPTDPFTVALYDTYPGPPGVGMCGDRKCNGAFGIDVRNADGLIVISDMTTGFWAFRMEGFNGWSGEQWGMPNISSVQDWDRGPALGVD